MVLLPVIERELRAASRLSSTFTMRMLGVFALTAATVYFAVTSAFGPNEGLRLFSSEHRLLLLAIWLLAPFLAADVISRERREGTLPLLSLTALRPVEVAVAKTLVHGLRAFGLWLAVIPVLAIPLLLGGVTRADLAFAAALHFSSIALGLAAGLLASSFSKRFVRAQALAALLAFAFAVLLTLVVGLAFFFLFIRPAWGKPSNLSHEIFWEIGIETGLYLSPAIFRAMGSGNLQWLAGGVVLAFALLTFLWVLPVVAWRIRASWRDKPSSQRWLAFQDLLCRPMFFREWLKRWMKRRLQANPIGWLEQRTWNGRLVMWSWMAVVISIYSYTLANFSFFVRGFAGLQTFPAVLLAISMAASASGSFRRERETGVLELLLVSPLKESDIVWGRILGVYQQFTPALALLFGVWIWCSEFLLPEGVWTDIGAWLVMFLTVPPIGLYFSLAQTNFMGSFLRTLLMTVVIPVGMGTKSFLLAAEVQIVVACLLTWQMHSRLVNRKFPLDRGLTG